MNIFRIFVSLFAVASATACTTLQQNAASIPRQELDSLLTSQGLVEPWQVDVYGNGNPRDGWTVYVREKLRQLGPNICVTHRHDFFVIERSASGYGIASADSVQEVALIECILAKPKDFVPIVSSNGDLPDSNLRRVIGALPALQRMAEAGQGAVQFHYERQELREMLTQRSGREIFQIIVYTPESITVSFHARPQYAVNLSFSFDGDRLGEHAYVTSSVLIGGSP